MTEAGRLQRATSICDHPLPVLFFLRPLLTPQTLDLSAQCLFLQVLVIGARSATLSLHVQGASEDTHASAVVWNLDAGSRSSTKPVASVLLLHVLV